MRIAIHQPHAFPWLGYLNKVKTVDLFVLLDETQYVKQEWQNRNYISHFGARRMITIPLQKSDHDEFIKNKYISYDHNWQRNIWSIINNNYKGAPFWREYEAPLKSVIFKRRTKHVDFCVDILYLLMSLFNIKTTVIKASELGELCEKKTELVLEICKKVGAKAYLSGVGARSYLLEGRFKQEEIDLLWQDYPHPHYGQFDSTGSFRSHLWSFDALMNLGRDAVHLI
ncbi:WbqC family protein [Rhizobium sp. PAMB 3174]